MSESNPLAPYLFHTPSLGELMPVAPDELRRIIDAARRVEKLDDAELDKTREWARSVREAAEAALAKQG